MKNLIGVTSAFFRIPLIVTLIPGFGVWYSVRGAVVGHGDRAIAVGNRARPGLRASGAGLAFTCVGKWAKCRALDTSIPVSPPADMTLQVLRVRALALHRPALPHAPSRA